jgi:glutathione S-transferase
VAIPHLRVLCDSDLRAIWRSKGGSFHGPNVETGTMPEANLLPWLGEILGGGLSDSAVRAIWKMKGGKVYGPRIETGSMPEADLLPFLRGLLTALAPVKSGTPPAPAPVEAATRILEFLGCAVSRNLEPGADSRRDHVAALIEAGASQQVRGLEQAVAEGKLAFGLNRRQTNELREATEALEAELAAVRADAARYRWLRDQGLGRADVSLGHDPETGDTAFFHTSFGIPEPAGMAYEDGEWSLTDLDAVIDAAISAAAPAPVPVELPKPCK